MFSIQRSIKRTSIQVEETALCKAMNKITTFSDHGKAKAYYMVAKIADHQQKQSLGCAGISQPSKVAQTHPPSAIKSNRQGGVPCPSSHLPRCDCLNPNPNMHQHTTCTSNRCPKASHIAYKDAANSGSAIEHFPTDSHLHNAPCGYDKYTKLGNKVHCQDWIWRRGPCVTWTHCHPNAQAWIKNICATTSLLNQHAIHANDGLPQTHFPGAQMQAIKILPDGYVKVGSNSVDWQGTTKGPCHLLKATGTAKSNAFCDIWRNLRRDAEGIVFNNQLHAYQLSSDMILPDFENTAQDRVVVTTPVSPSIAPGPQISICNVHFGPGYGAERFTAENLDRISDSGRYDAKKFSAQLLPVLGLPLEARSQKLLEATSEFWDQGAYAFNMSGLYAKMLHYALLTRRLEDENLHLIGQELPNAANPAWLNTSAAGLTVEDLLHPIRMQHVTVIENQFFRMQDYHIYRILNSAGNYYVPLAGDRVVGGQAYSMPRIPITIISRRPAPLHLPAQVPPTSQQWWDFAMRLAEHRQEYDDFIQGLYMAYETALASLLLSAPAPGANDLAQQQAAYNQAVAAYNQHRQLVQQHREWEIANHQYNAALVQQQHEIEAGLAQLGLNVEFGADLNVDALQEAVAGVDAAQQFVGALQVIDDEGYEIQQPGPEPLLPEQVPPHPGPAPGIRACPLGPYFNTGHTWWPRPIDYSYFYKLIQMSSPRISKNGDEYIELRNNNAQRRNQSAALLFGLIRAFATTALYAINITGRDMQRWISGVDQPIRMQAILASGIFNILGLGSAKPGQKASYFQIVENLLLECTGLRIDSSMVPPRQLNMNASQLPGMNNNAAYFMHTFGTTVPQYGNVLAVSRWLLSRPIEWGIGQSRPRANLRKDLVRVGQADNRGWLATRGTTEYSTAVLPTFPCGLVYYPASALNIITQGYMRAAAPVLTWDWAGVVENATDTDWHRNEANILVQPAYDLELNMFRPCTIRSYDWQQDIVVAPRLGREMMGEATFTVLSNLDGDQVVALAGFLPNALDVEPPVNPYVQAPGAWGGVVAPPSAADTEGGEGASNF